MKICWSLLCCLLTPRIADLSKNGTSRVSASNKNGASPVFPSSKNVGLVAGILNDQAVGSMVRCALLGRDSAFSGSLSSAVPDKLCWLVCLQVFELLSQWLGSCSNGEECHQHPCWQEYLKLLLHSVEEAACGIVKGRRLTADHSESLDLNR